MLKKKRQPNLTGPQRQPTRACAAASYPHPCQPTPPSTTDTRDPPVHPLPRAGVRLLHEFEPIPGKIRGDLRPLAQVSTPYKPRHPRLTPLDFFFLQKP